MDNEYTLVARLVAGESGAWHAFVETYSPHIERTIRRYVKDPEIERDLYVSLLEKLKSGALKKFDFRSRLTTWLFIVARNHCRDYYRGAKGVRHLLMALDGLGDAERRFFKLHYIQGLSLQATLESMRAESGETIDYLDIFKYRETVRRTIALKNLGNLLERLLRPDSTAIDPASPGSGRGPDRIEALESSSPSPEAYVDGMNLKTAVENLRRAIMRLPHRDQLVLKLRFEHKRSAREIGEILDLGNEKQVYRKLDRLYGELETMLLECGLPREMYREIAGDIENLCRFDDVWETGANAPGKNAP